MTTNNNLLFVDDEINALSMIKRNFINSPYNLYFASSAKDALEIIRNNEIKVIISDLQMPEINGIELLEIVGKNYQSIVKIVVTGNHQVPNILAAVNHVNIFRYIVKPINFREDLFPILEEACHIYDINELKAKLLLEKELGINKNENDLPIELLNSLSNSSINYINIIYSVIKKAPYMDKEILQKLLLDALSRLEVVKTNIQTIDKIINKK